MAAEASVAGVGEEETILYPQTEHYTIIITLATGKKEEGVTTSRGDSGANGECCSR